MRVPDISNISSITRAFDFNAFAFVNIRLCVSTSKLYASHIYSNGLSTFANFAGYDSAQCVYGKWFVGHFFNIVQIARKDA